MQNETEHFFNCPYCWEQISMLFEVDIESQTYIEDCEVCCQPIKISYTSSESEITSFDAFKAND